MAGLLAIAGLGAWRYLRTPGEEPISAEPLEDARGEDIDGDPDLTAGRM